MWQEIIMTYTKRTGRADMRVPVSADFLSSGRRITGTPRARQESLSAMPIAVVPTATSRCSSMVLEDVPYNSYWIIRAASCPYLILLPWKISAVLGMQCQREELATLSHAWLNIPLMRFISILWRSSHPACSTDKR